MAFGFKKRWTELFKHEINVTLICAEDEIYKDQNEAIRELVKRKLKEMNVVLIVNGLVREVVSEGVILEDGRIVEGNVPIWATGA